MRQNLFLHWMRAGEGQDSSSSESVINLYLSCFYFTDRIRQRVRARLLSRSLSERIRKDVGAEAACHMESVLSHAVLVWHPRSGMISLWMKTDDMSFGALTLRGFSKENIEKLSVWCVDKAMVRLPYGSIPLRVNLVCVSVKVTSFSNAKSMFRSKIQIEQTLEQKRKRKFSEVMNTQLCGLWEQPLQDFLYDVCIM